MKNVAVLTEAGAFALFFRPDPGEFDSSSILTPGEFSIQGKKKMLMPGGQPGGGGGRGSLGAAEIDWFITNRGCITLLFFL